MTIEFICFSEKEIVVAAVACGDRLDDTLTMLKSCIMFSRGNPIKFIIMADDDLMLDFEEKLTSWKEIIGDKLRFTILPLKFPEKNADEWRKLFKPCAAQRLFLPVHISHLIQD